VRWRCAAVLLLVVCGCGEGSPKGLPDHVPFTVARTPAGEAPTADEIAAFTGKVTGMLAATDYFRWCHRHGHGLDASYDPAMPPYALWWQDTTAVKSGATVTFVHTGSAMNIVVPTAEIVVNTAAGYLASGDAVMRRLLVDYGNGISALFVGQVYGDEDPVQPYITARAIFTHNHAWTTMDGRSAAVDYDPIEVEAIDQRGHTVPNPDNPTYGSIWIRNMRSKDDVPHMLRTVPWLRRVVQDATDEEVRAAAAQLEGYLVGMARDIVDNGYTIRAKEEGVVWVPEEDMSSFVYYDDLFPNAECTSKLTVALLAYDDARGNDCGDGISSPEYEAMATSVHAWNWHIIRFNHLAATTVALVQRHDAIAEQLLAGLAARADTILDDEAGRAADPDWDGNAAAFYLAAAASGLPLTAREARFVQEQYAAAADHYATWTLWDLWADSVADGEYDYIPSRNNAAGVSVVEPMALAYLVEYCASPWRAPNTVELADCSVVLDPSRWGQQ
jgi:hypothetical protein